VPSQEEKSNIDDLQKTLYSRNAPDVRTRRKLRFMPSENKVKTEWERPPEETVDTELNAKYENHSMSFFTKLLIASFIFCIAAVGIGAYLFFNGANLISGDNIEININGPVSVPGGAKVSFDINVKNKNNVDLELADLSVDFPAGTTNPDDPSTELRNFRELLGDIPAGGSAKKTVSAIMFGEENLERQIVVSITYKVKNSTALFTKNTSYDVLINSSPILLTASSFDEITSGQEFDIKVVLKSNSQDTLKNVILKGSYPFGFTYLSASPKPTINTSTWLIGDIPPGGEKTITIQGKVQGEDSETRVFRFVAGARSSSDPEQIGTQYMSAEHSMIVQKPFVTLAIGIDGDDTPNDHVGQFGRNERVSVSYFNNLPTAVANMVITTKLSGSAYDKTAVQPDGGYFNSATNEIIWNAKTNPELSSVSAGGEGRVSFSLVPKDTGTAVSPIVNPTVMITASIAGNRTQGSSVPEKLSSIVSKTSKISSNISLSGRVLRSVGPFVNTGPVPPKAEVPTTYTVIWTIDNTSSAVGSTLVTASLPAYVKWLGVISPTNENVSYDENKGIITWDAGVVSANTLGSARRRELYFQVSLLPSVIQINQTPVLVNRATLTATDKFTGAQLESAQDSLTTRFSTDPSYKEGMANVVK
jgi:hypothetical protein